MTDTYTSQINRQNGQKVTVHYTESDGLLWLSIKNFLLNLVTLTIYRFWAKTHVRRHIWSNVKINGEALEYTGTGKELFIGALLIFAIIGVPVIGAATAAQLIYGPESAAAISIQFLIIIGFLLLYGMALYRARRYRLSRTLWRGIRGSLTGSPTSFSLLYFGAMLLRSMTMGWSTPAMNLNIQQRMIGDMTFGNRSFLFGGPAGPLYKRFALCWFLTPVILLIVGLLLYFLAGGTEAFSELSEDGMDEKALEEKFQSARWLFIIFGSMFAVYIAYSILWTFYTAREMQVFASYSLFDKATFEFDVTVGSLISLWFGNLLIIILTLGIGQPYVVQRMVRFICDRLRVIGTVDFLAIQQSTAALDKHGEGLVDAFDIDAF